MNKAFCTEHVINNKHLKQFLLTCFLLAASVLLAQSNYTRYVNPFVGTGGHGHTFPGATTPFAMVQLSPDTRIDGSWDGCSGYHYSDSIIYGFSHTHLSGTGCSDYGDINFMPTFVSKPVKPITTEGKLFYTFDRKTESASPGYYTVTLNNGIKVELSASTRTGIQKYTYKRTGYAWITLDLNHRDQLLEGLITESDKQTYSGFRRSRAWAENQLVYFYTRISKAADARYIVKDSSGNYRLHLGYWVRAGESILVKTALSSVDETGARQNMEAEINHWDFAKVKAQAKLSWEKELGRIKVFGGSLTEKQNFYTALYHCMIHPNTMNDADGRYRGRDKQVHTAAGYNYYTVFSLWDTYRALHPLLNIIDKNRSFDFMMTFKAQFEQSGRLPMWELWGNETNCMIGFHSVSVILDAFAKGVIDKTMLKLLYPAVLSEAMNNRAGLDKFREKGYLSIEDESESVSKTLEYSYDMWCASEIAGFCGEQEDADSMRVYADAWRNVYNVRSGFMTPRSNGDWIKDFDPRQVNNHFTEANAWQYRFAVQHNYQAVSVDTALSRMFNMSSVTTGREQSDISGLIGQYAHGNEPSHHFAYLFSNPDSAAKYVRHISRQFYKPVPDGLCGNEDCGQMSAWYVFSALGFYPVTPGTSTLQFGHMLFDSAQISDGNSLIRVHKRKLHGFSDAGLYSPSMEFDLNDARANGYIFFGHGVHKNRLAEHASTRLPAPLIASSAQVFTDSLQIEIMPNDKGETTAIRFRINDSDSASGGNVYEAGRKLIIYENTILKAAGIDAGGRSGFGAYAAFYKRPNLYSIQIKNPYNKQYSAGGPDGLLDGLQGGVDWRKGLWQGYQGQEFECVVDMQQSKRVDSVHIGFLQDQRSWIFFPDQVYLYGSNDSIHFEEIDMGDYPNRDSSSAVLRSEMTFRGNSQTYRYLKIRATPYGKLPAWHPGAGGEAFIFVDEIEIR